MHTDYQVAIIGAGFGGLIAALRLKNSGKNSFIIFERAGEIGGTWRDNSYPGCGCDVESNLYSISSEQNPNWSSTFSSQEEILQYLKDVIKKNDLQKHIRYNIDIVDLQFIEEAGCWQVTDQNQKSVIVKMVILATGPFNRISIPPLTGIETFEGKKFHSAEWDHTADLAGKKVAVIGTGASAIQIVPNIAPFVEELYVFQRSAPWILPKKNVKASSFKKLVFRYFPLTQKLPREFIYWLREVVGSSFIGNDLVHKIVTGIALKKLKKEVPEAELRKKLTPNYKLGCKRILLADDFYPTLAKPNVHLVTDNIISVTSGTIVTKDKVYETDIIIFATGFFVADIDGHVKIAGKEGRILSREWEQGGAEGFRGITVSGYPNMAFILGPNSGLSHSSALHIMESQMNYINDYIDQLLLYNNESYFDVKPDVQTNYNNELQSQFKYTVWASGCKSYYYNKNGKNTTIYPKLTGRYRRETKKFDKENYNVFNTNEKDMRKNNGKLNMQHHSEIKVDAV